MKDIREKKKDRSMDGKLECIFYNSGSLGRYLCSMKSCAGFNLCSCSAALLGR